MSQRDVLCGAWGKPNKAVEPTAYSFGSAALRLRFRRRLTAGVRLQVPPEWTGGIPRLKQQ